MRSKLGFIFLHTGVVKICAHLFGKFIQAGVRLFSVIPFGEAQAPGNRTVSMGSCVSHGGSHLGGFRRPFYGVTTFNRGPAEKWFSIGGPFWG